VANVALFVFFPVKDGPRWWEAYFVSLFSPPVDFLWVDCGRLMRRQQVLSSPICFVKKIFSFKFYCGLRGIVLTCKPSSGIVLLGLAWDVSLAGTGIEGAALGAAHMLIMGSAESIPIPIPTPTPINRERRTSSLCHDLLNPMLIPEAPL
jgi:hypothetical protein